jgi:hypothetical protein
MGEGDEFGRCGRAYGRVGCVGGWKGRGDRG